MHPAAKLSDLVEALEFESEDLQSYFDRLSGRTVIVESSILDAVEDEDGSLSDVPDWQKDEVEIARAIASDDGVRFIAAPDKFEFNEYQHMERFIESVATAESAGQLAQAIRGSGAFRRFKNALRGLGLEQRWYQYRDEAMKQFVIEWAENNHVAYDDDLKTGTNR
ncbi:MAG TPA: UPF0158 family protein [Candidatus Angelobacter sp.]|nr:UPF0158 family protein [Candidatus Angelobacter sp.]